MNSQISNLSPENKKMHVSIAEDYYCAPESTFDRNIIKLAL